MKFQKLTLMALCVISFSASLVCAGGISGGGGGTTVPDPIKPEALAWTFEEFAPFIAYSWLLGAERNFDGLSEAEKTQSPLKILFGSPNADKRVFAYLRSAQVEMRMNSACIDYDGVEREGSVHTMKPGNVCLSVFLMAPKLNVALALKEASALYLHEISHLVGANEPEAVAIQKLMLRDLWYANPAKIIAGAQFAGGTWSVEGATLYVKRLLKNPALITASEIEKIAERFDRAVDGLNLEGESFSAIGAELHDEILPYRAVVESIQDYLCAGDSKLALKQRRECKRQIAKEFADAKEVSARDYLLRRVDYAGKTVIFDPRYFGAAVDRVKVSNLRSRADVVKALKQWLSFLNRVEAQARVEKP